MMDELGLTTGNSSKVELTKSNTHSNEVELDPLTGASKSSDSSRRFNERLQSDVEKLKDGSIHRHRYKLHESNQKETNVNQSTSKPLSSISSDLASSLPSASSRLPRLSSDRLPSSSGISSSRLPLDNYSANRGTSSSRLRHLLDEDDDDLSSTRRSRIRDFEPVGARLAEDLGIEVHSKPVSFNYDQSAKRRAHEALLREIDDEAEKFRTLPPKDNHRFNAREQMFVADWEPRDLRYLSKEGRSDLIRPMKPYIAPEQPFKHKRKSKYGKFVEGF